MITANDGWRVLICRYRPRALPKKDETWDVWFSQLGPSPKLHADAYGKNREKPLEWPQYVRRYLREMKNKHSRDLINCLARMVSCGAKLTLLCSSACLDEHHCHRSLLKKLIEEKAAVIE
jgi:uncharacterized protein YeaO (DUF488 family)